MTKEELKIILASKENKLAQKAISIIENSESYCLKDLEDLVANGCSDRFYQRDPSHPRSRFITKHVIDSCFEVKLGVTDVKTDGNTSIASLGPVYSTADKNKLIFFSYLLDKGFKPGDSSYRGSLFPHILNCCFYQTNTANEASRKTLAKDLAKILVDKKQIDINFYASNNYHWVGSLDNLEFLLSLGANPKNSGLIDCAITYVACSTNTGEPENGRIDVIKKLLDLGAKACKPIEKRVGSDAIRKKLEEQGLLQIISTQLEEFVTNKNSTLKGADKCGLTPSL